MKLKRFEIPRCAHCKGVGVVKEKRISGKDLILGFRGKHVHFRHRPLEKRTAEQKADYYNLMFSIKRYGIENPLITFKNHVLVGMRRCEIMQALNIDYYITCWEIQEDVNEWIREDLSKIEILKKLMREIKY